MAVPCSLHQRAHRGNTDLQRERNADHAFAAYQADFQRLVPVHQRQQGDSRVIGKVDVLYPLPGFIHHFAVSQHNLLHVVDQRPIVFARQRGEQAIGCGCFLRNRHGDLGCCRVP